MERIGDYIFTEAIFSDEDEKLGLKAGETSEDSVRFNIQHLVAWNNTPEGNVTIRLVGGVGFTLIDQFEEFDKFMRRQITNKIMKRE